jgi:hypothetical protein
VIKILLLSHPYQIRTSRREFEIDEPMSVADFCKKFNIPLILKAGRKHGIGSTKAVIRLNKSDATEESIIDQDSSITIGSTWLFPAGPWIPERGFQVYLNELLAEGKGISGYPPFEELYDFATDHLR